MLSNLFRFIQIRVFIFLLFIGLPSLVFADSVHLENLMGGKNLDSIYYLPDSISELTIYDVIRSKSFQPLNRDSFVKGINKGSFWIKFVAENPTEETIDWILQIYHINYDFVDFYSLKDDKIINELHMGDNVPFANRVIPHESNLFPIKTYPKDQNIIYIRVSYKTEGMFNFTMQAWTYKEFINYTYKYHFFVYSSLFGIILLVAINTFFYFSTKIIAYIWYVFYLISIIFTGITNKGAGYLFFWHDWIWLTDMAPILFPALSYLLAILFTRSFLDTKRSSPKLDIFFIAILILSFMTIVFLLLDFRGISIQLIFLLSAVSWVYPFIGYYIWFKGKREARFYAIAWTFWAAGMTIGSSRFAGLINSTIVSDIFPVIGVFLESMFFSFALADRINIINAEKDELELKYTESLKKSNAELELKVAERTKELQQKSELLESINRDKDIFFSVIAHDLRGPISTFKMATQIMYEDADNFSTEKIFLQQIQNSAESIHSLLENLLEWSKAQQGLIECKPTQLDCYQVIEKNLHLLRPAANTKSILLENKIKPETSIKADENLFNSIIRNLITNSIKFSPKNKSIEIGISADNPDYTTLYVRDYGVGISKNIMENLFKLNIKTSRKGTQGEAGSGLGLHLCKEFIGLHKGKIWVESKVGEGSTFYITLPR